MMLCGEQYSVQVAAFMLQGLESNLYELFVTSESHLFGSGSGFGFGFGFGRVRVRVSESHQATAPRYSSLMQLACIAPKLCPSS